MYNANFSVLVTTENLNYILGFHETHVMVDGARIKCYSGGVRLIAYLKPIEDPLPSVTRNAIQ